MRQLIVLFIVVLIGWQGHRYYQPRAAQSPAVVESPAALIATPRASSPRALAEPVAAYQCDGRIHCSQMTSCEEATYFLRNCPDTKMDGDNDGVPCEQQWCGR
ncbi:MAG: excalibur calcium-binding domain-containing protein [Burkholderiales bacterium]|nr:excalibur calcium-binding domain-containing protein [Burkholderiales bacterium]